MSFPGKRRLVVLLLLLVVTLLLPVVAQAQQPPPPDGEETPWPEAIGRFVGIWFANLGIGFQKAIAAVFWFLEKLAAAFSGLLMDESLWETLRGTLLDTLISVMPGALGNLVLGSTGLLYVALMLAGVLMTMPLLGESRPVQAWRVIVWGAVLITLGCSCSHLPLSPH